MIVQELRAIQHRCGYLPEEELRLLAQRLNVPLHRLHEVASFYPSYRLQPGPAAEVKVCRDMACHLRGADRLQRALEVVASEVGPQCEVSGVSCLGQCDRPVAVTINHHVYRGVPEAELRQHIRLALAKEPLPHQKADRSPLGWKIDPYNGLPQYDAVKKYLGTKDDAPSQLLKELETSGLRGMGGAGFPTFRKWAAVQNTKGDEKFIVCNADESEPGTFKDRELMRRTPYLVIEGMVLAALVTGATKGYLYIRHEYEEELKALGTALASARALGICGDNILGTNRKFNLEIYVSPGGYIQGEETALLEAIEDRRGEPRNKPPFPTTNGLFNKPTVINNVETLSWVPAILLRGGAWYRDGGTNGATGMRFVSISGDVNRPGVYEVPFGQKVRELLELAGGVSGGQRLKAIALSGPSGGFLPPVLKAENLPPKFVQERLGGAKTMDLLELPLDLNTVGAMGGMLGAACVVYGDKADMVDQALNCVEFFRNESCGKCVPCRMGSQKMTEVIREIMDRRFRRENLGVINELTEAMQSTSICGLGQVAANPIASLLKHFPEELNRYLAPGR